MTGEDSDQRRHTVLWLSFGVVVVVAVFLVPAMLEWEKPRKPAPPPHSSAPVVVVYGDSQGREKDHARVVKAFRSRSPHAVFHCGDMIHDGDDAEQWQGFLTTTAALREEALFYPALGNHEENSPLYFEAFELEEDQRWYAVRFFGMRFVVLDSNWGLSDGSEQYTWLDQKLASNTEGFTLVVMHHPPFSTGPMPEDEMGLRGTVVPLFEKHAVDIVFAGHDHDYERSEVNGVVYVVSGGGGARLYSQKRSFEHSRIFSKEYHFCELFVDGGDLRVRVIDSELRLIESFAVTAR